MRHLSLARALVVGLAVLAGATPAASQPSGAARAAPRNEAELNALMRDVAGQAQEAQSVIIEAGQTLSAFNKGVLDAMQRGADPASRAADRAWAEGWRAEQQARLSGLRAKAGAFKGIALAGPEPTDIELRRRLATFRQIPQLTQAVVNEVVTTLTPLLDVVVAAAGSDKAALSQLPAGSITASILALQVENRYLGAQSGLSSAEGPGRALMRANIAGNEGVIVVLEHQRALVGRASPSAAASATRLRGRAAEMRRAASEVSEATKVMLGGKMLQDLRREAPATHAKLAGAVATFEDSARVETEIAGVLDALAGALERGDAGRSAFEAKAAELDSLIDHRVKTAQARMAIAGS